MKNRSLLSLSSLAVILAAVFALSCKKKFDEPPPVTDAGVTANKTIKELKTLYPTSSGELKLITDDIIIRGIVVGNDRTGNIYKMIYIQDATNGIEVDIDATGLYNVFPVGREVFILCKGLYIANENSMIKLATRVVENGTPVAAGIRGIYMDTYIKRGALNQKVDTTVISNITQLNSDHQARLIRLNGFEVTSSDLSKTYADTSVNKASTNINLQSCGGQTIIMRTSGYANFAGVRVPQGNGTVTAIYTVFNTTKQLIVRDSTDLQLNNPRCGSGVPAGLTYKTIQEIRALGAGAIIPANTGIRGTIVSSTLNEATGNYRIQDGSGYGIQLRFPLTNPNYILNDSVKVDISNLSVDLFNGDMQINNVGNSEKVGTGTVTPRVTTAAAIATNVNTWASTVVRLDNVSITFLSASGTTGNTYTVTDATGSVQAFIRTTLGYTPPSSAASITGYVSQFNGTPQLTIRSAADVVGGGTPPVSGTISLTTSPVLIDFNNLGSGLPTGVYVKQESTSSSIGNDATVYGGTLASKTAWNQTSLGVKNFASATGLTATSDQTAQDASANRALGFRQTGTAPTGGDPGAAFTFKIANTTGKSNLKLEFLLQSLDAPATPGRTTTWVVDYGIGDNPTTFTTVTTTPGTLTTVNGTFASTAVTVNFPAALNNQAGPIWIRIVALNATTGSGSRASTAIDDAKFTWN